eukprot:scaffold32700_cov21-Prasinocladus_malaysianus.AAC.1
MTWSLLKTTINYEAHSLAKNSFHAEPCSGLFHSLSTLRIDDKLIKGERHWAFHLELRLNITAFTYLAVQQHIGHIAATLQCCPNSSPGP